MKVLVVFLSIMIALPLMGEIVWKDDFNSIQNWYDNKTDASFRAVILPGKTQGTAILQQKGDGNWGKVAYVVSNIDLDKFNVVKVKVNNVDKSGDYKVMAISQDWAESYIIIDRGNGKGTFEGNIKDITGWSGKKTFNIVLVVEGKDKKVEFDSVELSDGKTAEQQTQQ